MDLFTLSTSEPESLARYLRRSSFQLGSKVVTDKLLAGIENESIPPRVYSIWLTASGDCQVVNAGLRQQFSKSIRHSAIARFGQLFRSRRMKEVWTAIGDTSGIVELLGEASVADVKHFCREIRRTATSKVDRETRQRLAGELYKALQYQGFPSAVLKTLVKRPLASQHHKLLPACSEDLVVPVFEDLFKTDRRQAGAVFEVHVTSFRQRCFSTLKDENTKVDTDSLKALLDVKSNETTLYLGSQLSENVAFALEALRVLADRKSMKDVDSAALLATLSVPLFRRLCRHKCKPDVVAPAIDSYLNYFRAHIGLGVRSLDISTTSVIACAVRLWSRHPNYLQDRLISLLSLAPSTQNITAPQIQSLMELMPWSLRYGFLRLTMRSLSCFRIDIDSDDDLKLCELTWTPELILGLPNVEARSLLQRLIRVKTNDIFNAGWGSYDERFRHDPNMVLLWVSRDDSDLVQMATEAVEESKKEATKARQQADRARWVSYALHCATASASLDLYRATLLWAKRYTRDPLTATEVYSENSLHRSRSLSLLCGFSDRDKNASSTPDEVYERVRKGNLTCEELLQTACDSLTEPSFQNHNWNGFTQLFDLVVQMRGRAVNSIQDKMRLSDEQVYDIVWKDTIETCLKLERLGLEDKNAPLGFNSVGGPLLSVSNWSRHSRHVLKDPRRATLKFLDTLAQRRDQLWTQYRPTRYPATSTLPDLYPKGLSVDYLLPVEIGKDGLSSSPDMVPYLRGRAERAIFVAAEAAFSSQPEDDEIDHAIGSFEEDWKMALKLYVASSSDRLAAAMTAWKYAIGSLSAPRLDPVEAFLYWSPIFQSALSILDLYGPWKEELSDPPISALFRIEDSDLPTEWHPDPRYKADEVKARRLDRTRLDDMVHKVSHYTNDVKCVPYRNDVHLHQHKPCLIWSRYNNKRVPATMRETFIVAIMLYIGGQHNISPGLLSEPFPPGHMSPRFPRVYLDGEFLDLEDLGHGSMWVILERLSRDIPPTLLLALIKGVIAVADREEERTPVDAFKLLMILVKSDRPQVGLDMIHDIILERPLDSSWQRSLLTNGLFNVLPKQVAEDFLQRLSQDMQRKLAQQATRKPESGTSQAPLIKVTTVKMLSKLLSGAQFIDARSASNILMALLARARHLDIRVSVVETLIEILATTKDSQIKDDILVAFEQYAVPAMASIDERKPPSEQDWQRYEQDETELLEVYMEGNPAGLPPMLASVVFGLQKVDTAMKDQLFIRVLLPTLTGSIESNKRWMTLFLRHLGVSAQELPSLPLKVKLLNSLLDYPEHLTNSVLELWLQAFITRYDPSPTMLEVTQRVQENPKLRESNAGKHWLSMFNPNTSLILNGKRPAALLRYEWQARVDGPSIEQLQNIALRHAEVILRKADANFTDWNIYCTDLKPPVWHSNVFSIWLKNVRPVVEELCRHIEGLRSKTWQNDLNRVPRVLPDTFGMRLWLMLPPDTGNHDADLENLCHSIANLLNHLGVLGRAMGELYSQIGTFVRSIGLSVDDLMKVALMFGNVDVRALDTQDLWSTPYDLSIDLARQLIQGANAPASSELRQKVVDMIYGWTKSVDEDVRMVGFRLLDSKADRTGKKPWYAGDEGRATVNTVASARRSW